MTVTRVCSDCKAEKPLSEFHRHKRARDGRTIYCKLCSCARAAAYRAAHPKKVAALNAQWRKDNPQKVAALKAAAHKRNPAASARRVAKHKATNPGRAQTVVAQWKRDNPAKVNAACAARKARKRQATPAWANKFFIEEIYDLAQRRTKATGIEWQVDHIVPLKHPLVQGLHVEHNLRVIPAVENLKKKNSWWPNMPEVAHG